MTRSTLTTWDPLRHGTVIRVDDEPRPMLVCACTGAGPYTLTVRPETRLDRWWAQLKFWARRPREWWLETHCLPDEGWCWRKATADCLCDRHWLAAVEDGAEDL